MRTQKYPARQSPRPPNGAAAVDDEAGTVHVIGGSADKAIGSEQTVAVLLPAAPDASALAVETLHLEVLRLATQAAEGACRKLKMPPKEAALAVIDAFQAARAHLVRVTAAGSTP